MRDVARRAGVSVATVSRALAGSPLVVPEVRNRVVRAAEELEYVASRLPANLRSKSSRILALVVGNVRNPYFPDLIGGCEETAQQAGYSLIFADSNEDPARESVLLEQLALERVAGVALAAAGGATKGLRRLRTVGTAVVEVDRYIQGLDLDTVCVNDSDSVYGAMQHLLQLGHRRIAFVGGPTSVSTGRDREHGYERALADAAIAPDPTLVVHADFREAMARDLTHGLMAVDDPPSAIITVNNLATVGVMRALRSLGRKVPDDVSIVGFDDLLAAELFDPPLTAIAQPTYAIGQRAIELLLRRIKSPEAPINNVVLETELVIRGSTGAVRKDRRRSGAA